MFSSNPFFQAIANFFSKVLGKSVQAPSSISADAPTYIVPALPETMQALQITREPSSSHETPKKPILKSVTIKTPVIKPGSVLVKIHAAAINPSDALNASGGFPYTTYPRVPGRDFAGIVVDGPTHLRGKKVFGTSGHDLSFTRDGAHAEYCLVPEDGVGTMPIGMSFAQAATIGVPFTTAWLTLERAHTRPNDTVLVVGAFGAVGTAVCQIAKAKGCRVLTAARRDDADIDTRVDSKFKGAKALTEGAGPSVVVDTVGDPDMMRSVLEILAKRGRLSYIAAPKTYDADFSYNMKEIYRAEKCIIGCNSLNYTSEEMADVLGKLTSGFEKELYHTHAEDELVKVGFGEDALEAYGRVREGKGVKYVICAS